MSAYDNNPRAQARAILRMDGADLRTRNEEELATLSSKCLTTGPIVALGSFGHLGNRVQLDARVEMLRGNAVEMQGCIDTLQVESPAKPRLYRARVDDQVMQDNIKTGRTMFWDDRNMSVVKQLLNTLCECQLLTQTTVIKPRWRFQWTTGALTTQAPLSQQRLDARDHPWNERWHRLQGWKC